MNGEKEAIPEEVAFVLAFLRPRCEAPPALREKIRALAARETMEEETLEPDLRRAVELLRPRSEAPPALREWVLRLLVERAARKDAQSPVAPAVRRRRAPKHVGRRRHRRSGRRSRPQRERQIQGSSQPMRYGRLAARVLTGAALSIPLVGLFAVARGSHEAASWLILCGMFANVGGRFMADRCLDHSSDLARFHGWSTFLLFVVAQAVLSSALIRRVPGYHGLWEFLVPLVPSFLVFFLDVQHSREMSTAPGGHVRKPSRKQDRAYGVCLTSGPRRI